MWMYDEEITYKKTLLYITRKGCLSDLFKNEHAKRTALKAVLFIM